MLFVHDDEADVFKRAEQGRASSDQDLFFSGDHAPPLIPFFAGGEVGVEDSHVFAKAMHKPPYELWGEADFGNQNDDLFIFGQRLFDGPQVNFGFPTASDSKKQEDFKGIAGGSLTDGFHGFVLSFGQNRAARLLLMFRNLKRGRRGFLTLSFAHFTRGCESQRINLSRRVQIILGHPLEPLHGFFTNGGFVHDGTHIFNHFNFRWNFIAGTDQNATGLPSPQRNLDAGAGLNLTRQIFGKAIGQGPRQGGLDSNLYEFGFYHLNRL